MTKRYQWRYNVSQVNSANVDKLPALAPPVCVPDQTSVEGCSQVRNGLSLAVSNTFDVTGVRSTSEFFTDLRSLGLSHSRNRYIESRQSELSFVLKAMSAVTGRPAMLRKSRGGCRECKLRKVKCDEVKPVCSNCNRRYINLQSCDWSTDTSRSNTVRSGRRIAVPTPEHPVVAEDRSLSSQENIPHLALRPPTVSDIDQWRSMELQLMHHYTAVVSHSMPNCSGPIQDIWQRTVPQFAFGSEVVLNPMLALSALHLHSYSAGDAALKLALRRYLDRALLNHRQALSTPGEELSEQLWLSVLVLTNMYWLLAHQSEPGEKYELPFQAWNMLQGVNLLFVRKKDFLSQLGYSFCGSEPEPQINPKSELPAGAQIQLQDIDLEMTALLEALDPSGISEEDRNTYLEVKNYVLIYYQAYFSGAAANSLRRFITIMTVRCPPRYRAMLESHDPLAMALLARMLVLLRGLNHVWWMNGKGDYEVLERDIRGIGDLMPESLRWMMDWPYKVLNGEIILNRSQ